MKRSITVALAALLIGIPVFAMGGKESASPLAPVTMHVGALKGPTGIGMIRLFESQPALPDSVTVAMSAVASADIMAAKLLSGELDAAVLPVNMAAKLYNSGLDYKMVAVVGNGMVKLVTTDRSIASLADLRGRDVYVAGQGATPEYLLRTVLPKAGIDPNADVHLIFNMPYPEIAASVVAGKIAVAVLPEPFATQALAGNPAAFVPFSLTERWKDATGLDDYPMSVFVVKSSFIAERKAAVKALMAAYDSSIKSVKADPATAGALVERFEMGLKAPIATKSIPSANYVFLPADKAKASVEALLSVFLSLAPASVGGKLPDAAFYAVVGY